MLTRKKQSIITKKNINQIFPGDDPNNTPYNFKKQLEIKNLKTDFDLFFKVCNKAVFNFNNSCLSQKQIIN